MTLKTEVMMLKIQINSTFKYIKTLNSYLKKINYDFAVQDWFLDRSLRQPEAFKTLQQHDQNPPKRAEHVVPRHRRHKMIATALNGNQGAPLGLPVGQLTPHGTRIWPF